MTIMTTQVDSLSSPTTPEKSAFYDAKLRVDNDETIVAVFTSQNTPATTPGREIEEYQLTELPAARVSSNVASVVGSDVPTPSLEDLKRARRAEYIGFAALMFCYFLEGWNDGTNGPMLPAIQAHYKIKFAILALVYITNACGFITGAFANIYLSQKLGFGKTLLVGALFQLVAYVLQAPAPPYPLFAMAYLFSGFGLALQNSQAMVFTVSLRNSSTKMGIIQACYGFGAFVSPLVATQFSGMRRWSYHYLISMGGAVFNIIFLTLAFRLQNLDVILVKAGQVVRESGTSKDNLYSQIMGLKVVHLLAFFALAYVGVEFTLAGMSSICSFSAVLIYFDLGWIVTFIIDKRHGGPSSGYISSGFFAGMTLGRVGLLWLNKLVGERRVIWLYLSICLGLDVVIWVVPSLIGNGVAVSFIGLFLGPIFPIIMNRTAKLVPHWLISGSVGWITGLGISGSAVLPLVTGAMSDRLGISSLHPLVVSVLCVMAGLWLAIPGGDPHRSE